ncbi:CBN-KIN-24 protein [Caenorhabditis brenneri]|uniref:Tyrosine-protein kinase n=1 Tax=Caenorhabditis brenneri TaxID=135651 RepID=G0NWI6_CAEBE|nr:CBN-KIN-24 protein [Caenorhabditis brenneri]
MRRGEKCEKSQEKQEKTGTGGGGREQKEAVQNLKCYHGVQKKEEACKLMKGYPAGTFLIRSSLTRNEVKLVLFLSVKVASGDNDSNVHHYLILKGDGTYCLVQDFKENESGNAAVVHESPKFKTVTDLINYYRHHRLACKIRLAKHIKRPSWQLRNYQVVFDESGRLGAGNFCVVYKGKHVNKEGKEVNVAAIKVSKDTGNESAALMETRNLLMAEAKIMINYKHPNVILLYGLACDVTPFMVCMEFCAGGSLEDALKKFGKDMEEYERQILLLDAARGMRYLHNQKCIHRDLASRNCLISSEGLVKIADFGLSKTLEKNQTAFKEALKEAPLAWLAPECIQRESEFSIKTDVWAFGVVIFEVYNNAAKLFDGEDDTTVIRRIKRANMPTIENRTKLPSMQAVLSSIWTRKPDDRPDFQKVLEQLVAALLPIQPEDLKKMQINNLKGVTRTQMPNTSLEADIAPVVEEPNQDGSEKVLNNKSRAVEMGKKKTGNRRDRKSDKRTQREEAPKSRKPVPIRNTVRKGPGPTSE